MGPVMEASWLGEAFSQPTHLLIGSVLGLFIKTRPFHHAAKIPDPRYSRWLHTLDQLMMDLEYDVNEFISDKESVQDLFCTIWFVLLLVMTYTYW